jgi:beta-glucuronidase
MKLFFLLGCLILGSSVHAQDTILQNVNARAVQSLDGNWQYIVDPYETGNGARFFEDKHSTDASALVEYDFDHSPSLSVPGDWNSQSEKLLFYEGTIWYRRVFKARPAPGKRYILYFGAVNYAAAVYLNGHRLGEHKGGFTAFQFEVTGLLKDGDNSVVVRVNNTRKAEEVPTLSTDWWNYGGITRDVDLVECPATYIRDYSIGLDPEHPDQLRGYVRIDGATAAQAVTLSIPAAKLTRTLRTNERGWVSFAFPAPVLKKWSPKHPELYRVLVTSAEDSLSDRIGFRTISVRGKEILLNGQPIFLRGICIHDENPFLPGRPRGAGDERMVMQWAKDLNCNFVRLAHYPHDEQQIRIADEMGLLVWSEVPVYWGIAWENPGTLQNAEQQLTDMIARDQNRASIIIWSIGNETPNTPPRLRFMEALADSARSLDPSRLVAAAMLVHQQGHDLTVDDPLAAKLDLVSFNEYLGWYSGPVQDIGLARFHIPYDKPVVITEVGGDALGGYHGDSTTRWTEEYQALLFENQLRLLSGLEGLRGLSPWILVDFRSPRRMNPTYQDYWNRKGLISSTGQKKEAFYVLKIFYDRLAAVEEP